MTCELLYSLTVMFVSLQDRSKGVPIREHYLLIENQILLITTLVMLKTLINEYTLINGTYLSTVSTVIFFNTFCGFVI